MRKIIKGKLHLLHIIPDLRYNGVTSFCLDLVTNLPEYCHTLVYEDTKFNVDPALIYAIQSVGVNIINVVITKESINKLQGNVAIVYNSIKNIDLKGVISSLYYGYGNLPADCTADYIIGCSEVFGLYKKTKPFPHKVIPPAISSNIFSYTPKAITTNFTAGIIIGDSPGKYPTTFISNLLHVASPTDIGKLIITDNDCNVNIELKQKWGNSLVLMGYKPIDVPKLFSNIDCLIQVTAPTFNEPFSRLIYEAYANNTPVICEERNKIINIFPKDTHILYFKNAHELLYQLQFLKQDTEGRKKLVANGKLMASWCCIRQYIDNIKDILLDLAYNK